MRFMQEDQRVPTTATRVISFTDNWGFSRLPGSAPPGAFTGSIRSRWDENHPGFYKACKDPRKWPIVGPLDVMISSRTAELVNCTIPCTAGPMTLENVELSWNLEQLSAGLLPGDPNYMYGSSYIQNAETYVYTKAIANAKSLSAMIAENIADLEKTMSLLKKPLTSLNSLTSKSVTKKVKLVKSFGLYKQFVKGGGKLSFSQFKNLKKAEKLATSSSDIWLEYNMAIKPLVGDMDTLLKAYAFRASAMANKREVTVATKDLGNKSSVVRSSARQNLISSDWHWNLDLEQTVKVAGRVFWTMGYKDPVEYSNHVLGTEVSAIPMTVWELIPYSFVVDYFVNVGDFIQAQTPTPYISLQRGTVTTTVTTERKIRDGYGLFLDPYPYGNRPVRRVNVPLSTLTEKRIIRHVNVTQPTSPVMVPDPWSLSHSLTVAALMVKPIIKGLKLLSPT